MNRRGFLKALGIGAGAVAAAPVLSWVPTPLTLLRVPGRDRDRFLYGRISITGPTIYHLGREGVFVRAMNEELKCLSQDIARGSVGCVVGGPLPSTMPYI